MDTVSPYKVAEIIYKTIDKQSRENHVLEAKPFRGRLYANFELFW